MEMKVISSTIKDVNDAFQDLFEISPFPEIWNMLNCLEPFYVACFETSRCLENFSHVALLYSYKKKVLWLKASLPIGMKIIVHFWVNCFLEMSSIAIIIHLR